MLVSLISVAGTLVNISLTIFLVYLLMTSLWISVEMSERDKRWQ